MLLINQGFRLKNNIAPPSLPPSGELQGQVNAARERITKLEADVRDGTVKRKLIYEKIETMSHHAAEAMDALRKEMKDDIGEVHQRVNEVLAAVAELRGEMKGKR